MKREISVSITLDDETGHIEEMVLTEGVDYTTDFNVSYLNGAYSIEHAVSDLRRELREFV